MRRYPIHLVLLPIFPVTYLYSQNADQTPILHTLAAAVALLCTAVVMWLLLSMVLRNGRKAGLIASLTLLYFFSYGPLASIMYSIGLSPYPDRLRIRYLIAWICLYAGAVVLLLLERKRIASWTRLVNIVAICLVATSVALAVRLDLQVSSIAGEHSQSIAADGSVSRPDIYYILVDGYGRSDVLERLYNLDNAPFISSLRDRGFYVADSSRSNYIQTLLSLAGSLNMSYLDSILDKSYSHPADMAPLLALINNNEVMKITRNLGYKIIVYSSGISATEIRTADLFVSHSLVLTEFEQVLITMTPIAIIAESRGMQYSAHRNRLEFTLQHLGDDSQPGSPVFVFAHVIAPHPPFVFDADGNPNNPNRPFEFADGTHFRMSGGTPDQYRKGYSAYVHWLNGRLLQCIDNILAKSETPPVIILQSDHGPGSMLDWGSKENTNLWERTSNLTAIYTLGAECPGLYRSITPVNIFREVFNCVFSTRYSRLEDRSFYSPWGGPFQAIDVTSELDSIRYGVSPADN